MRYIYVGDRDVGVWALKDLIDAGYKPLALGVAEGAGASHARELSDLSGLSKEMILSGRTLSSEIGKKILQRCEPDWLISVHYPNLLSREILQIPKLGCLNLHPAYLPYNRGWHTPTWAILENTPIGATLHFMEESVDSGDIVAQERVRISADDTAHILYKKLKIAERQLFRKCIPLIAKNTLPRKSQNGLGTSHKSIDLFDPGVQLIDLDKPTTARQVLNQIRALTTSEPKEAAYFLNGKYKVRMTINYDSENNS